MDESVARHLQRNETADVLRRAKALIDRPEKWCKGVLFSGDARCVYGAINEAARGKPYSRAENDNHDGAQLALSEAVGTAVGLTPQWNNAPERTHAEVMAAFDRAIAIAEGR